MRRSPAESHTAYIRWTEARSWDRASLEASARTAARSTSVAGLIVLASADPDDVGSSGEAAGPGAGSVAAAVTGSVSGVDTGPVEGSAAGSPAGLATPPRG